MVEVHERVDKTLRSCKEVVERANPECCIGIDDHIPMGHIPAMYRDGSPCHLQTQSLFGRYVRLLRARIGGYSSAIDI